MTDKESPPDIDLGDNHTLRFYGRFPDRDLNAQYADIPDVKKYGAVIKHKAPDGSECSGAITFDGEAQRRLEPSGHPMWQVASWEPLTISPSVLCTLCGDHGFIRNGRWERA